MYNIGEKCIEMCLVGDVPEEGRANVIGITGKPINTRHFNSLPSIIRHAYISHEQNYIYESVMVCSD